MYNFIFYFAYYGQIKQTNGTPFIGRYFGSLFVLIAIVFHILMLFAITRFILFNFYEINFSFSLRESQTQKLFFWLPIFIPMFIIVFKYFNGNRIIKIVAEYQDKRVYSFINILRFFCICNR